MSSRSIRRKYGQNYLVDKAILFEMANHVSAKENDSFIEIGPGMGALTDLININNVNVTAIDIDENNIKALKTKFIGPAVFNFINEDILNYEIEGMDLRVVGNLPYNISTQIILKLLDNVNQIIAVSYTHLTLPTNC